MTHIISQETITRPIEAFDDVITPDIQRLLNRPVVDTIIASEIAQYETNGRYFMCGKIVIVKVDTREYLIDGQHRLTAYVELSRQFPGRKMDVSCECFVVKDNVARDAIYKIINTQTANHIAEMPTGKYALLNSVSRYFDTQFPQYTKLTGNPHSPKISLEKFAALAKKKQLFDREWKSAEMLIEYISRLNTFYSNCSAKQFRDWKVDTKNLSLVTGNNRLYLGVYRAYEWIDRLVDMFDAGGVIHDRHFSATHRPKILKATQGVVWQEYSGPNGTPNMMKIGYCYCCCEELHDKDAQCGHVISIYHEGPTTVSNLRPVCARCNLDMGCMHMEEYKKLIKTQLEEADDPVARALVM